MLGPVHQPRKGLRRFMLSNPGLLLSTISGLVCILALFGFTLWLSKQLFWCPEWAQDCHVQASVSRIADDLGLVQGVVAAIYAVALAGLVYTACALGEAAVWPILHKQAKTLKQLDSFLLASRGSIASLLPAYMATRSAEAFVVMVCITVATITPLTGSPVVGYAYTKQGIATEFTSTYQVGAGMRNRFIQTTPPSRLTGPVTDAFSLYTSWASELSQEPMPQFRDFVFNRAKLEDRGDISINAVEVQKHINCTGRVVELLDHDNASVTAMTHMEKRNTTRLRNQPELTVWVDRIRYLSEMRSTSTLVFAAINGSIEGGNFSEPTETMKEHGFNGLQAVACDVDVNLVNSSFQTGDDAAEFATVSHLNMLTGPTHPESPYGPRGDLAVWFGVMPVAMGISVHGAQPMFKDRDPLPRVFATYTRSDSHHWKLETLCNFINVSSGALATSLYSVKKADTPDYRPENTTLTSRKTIRRLDPSRSYYLLIPPCVILAMTLALAFWNYWIHERANIPIMRLADVAELIKSSQTADIREAASCDARSRGEASSLGTMKVKYGVVSGGIAGFGKSVSGF